MSPPRALIFASPGLPRLVRHDRLLRGRAASQAGAEHLPGSGPPARHSTRRVPGVRRHQPRHRSGPGRGDGRHQRPRHGKFVEVRHDINCWSLICCYNAARNDPYKESHHPRYTPLQKVPDTSIKEVGAKVSSREKAFLDPATDKS